MQAVTALAFGGACVPDPLGGATIEVAPAAPRPALMQIGILLSTFVRPPLEGRLDAAKAGRSAFSEPRPYDTQAPKAGRPPMWWPVCKNVIAGSWLIASVCSERMTQMSPANFAVCGSVSVSHKPDWPC